MGRWLIGLVLLAQCLPAQAETLTGRVVQIIDGNSVSLRLDRRHLRISIAGLGVPSRVQAHGERARTYLAGLVFNREVEAECTALALPPESRCRVRVQPHGCADCGKSLDVGLAMLSAGMAWWDDKRSPPLSREARDEYQAAEFMARLHRSGLWADARFNAGR